MNNKKKVILINGDGSNWYEQAIFIIKDKNEPTIPKNLVLEAEKIIQDYMSKKYKNTNPYNKQNIPKNKQNIPNNKQKIKLYNNILNISIFCTIAFICFLLYKIYI